MFTNYKRYGSYNWKLDGFPARKARRDYLNPKIFCIIIDDITREFEKDEINDIDFILARVKLLKRRKNEVRKKYNDSLLIFNKKFVDYDIIENKTKGQELLEQRQLYWLQSMESNRKLIIKFERSYKFWQSMYRQCTKPEYKYLQE